MAAPLHSNMPKTWANSYRTGCLAPLCGNLFRPITNPHVLSGFPSLSDALASIPLCGHDKRSLSILPFSLRAHLRRCKLVWQFSNMPLKQACTSTLGSGTVQACPHKQATKHANTGRLHPPHTCRKACADKTCRRHAVPTYRTNMAGSDHARSVPSSSASVSDALGAVSTLLSNVQPATLL